MRFIKSSINICWYCLGFSLKYILRILLFILTPFCTLFLSLWSGVAKKLAEGTALGSASHFSTFLIFLFVFCALTAVSLFFFLILHDCLPFLGALFYKTISSLCCISSLGFIPLTFLTYLWPAVYISPYTFRFWFW